MAFSRMSRKSPASWYAAACRRLVVTACPKAGTAAPVKIMTIAMTTTSSISEKPGRLLILVTSGLAHGRGNLFFPRDAVARECGLVGTILRVHRPCGPGRVAVSYTHLRAH